MSAATSMRAPIGASRSASFSRCSSSMAFAGPTCDAPPELPAPEIGAANGLVELRMAAVASLWR